LIINNKRLSAKYDIKLEKQVVFVHSYPEESESSIYWHRKSHLLACPANSTFLCGGSGSSKHEKCCYLAGKNANSTQSAVLLCVSVCI
jgi:hypothetical protein